MDSYKKLPTGLHVCSFIGADGVTRFKAMTQKQFNNAYKMNVWWTMVKNSLSSQNIKTRT